MDRWMDGWISLWDCSTKDASYSASLATILFKLFHDKEDQNKLQLEFEWKVLKKKQADPSMQDSLLLRITVLAFRTFTLDLSPATWGFNKTLVCNSGWQDKLRVHWTRWLQFTGVFSVSMLKLEV
jgi:hypothetical protein